MGLKKQDLTRGCDLKWLRMKLKTPVGKNMMAARWAPVHLFNILLEIRGQPTGRQSI